MGAWRHSQSGPKPWSISVQTVESRSLRGFPRAVDSGHGAAVEDQHLAQNTIRPAEAVLPGVFAAAAGLRRIDHVVFLHQLAGAAVGCGDIVHPARGDDAGKVALAVIGQAPYGDPLQWRPTVRSVPLLI